MVCLFLTFFFLSLSHTSEGSTCLREHEAKFVLDRLPVHVSVFGRGKCVSQRNKPNLASGVIVRFLLGLHACNVIISAVCSRSLIATFSKLAKTFRPIKVTADFSSDHVHLTTMSKKNPLWICLFSCGPPRSFILAASSPRTGPNGSTRIVVRAGRVCKLLWKPTSPSLKITFHSSQTEHYDGIGALSLVDFKAFSDNGCKTSVGLANWNVFGCRLFQSRDFFFFFNKFEKLKFESAWNYWGPETDISNKTFPLFWIKLSAWKSCLGASFVH